MTYNQRIFKKKKSDRSSKTSLQAAHWLMLMKAFAFRN